MAGVGARAYIIRRILPPERIRKIMRRLGILDRRMFYKILDSAKDKIKKIMFA
jgi:hypothetical protein